MRKNKTVALVLCLIFGMFGIHKFYLGQPIKGILYMFTLGIFCIGWIFDCIGILLMPEKEFNYKFNYER